VKLSIIGLMEKKENPVLVYWRNLELDNDLNKKIVATELGGSLQR